ncbi:metallophosphoesterase family protein [Leptolyngbya sp. AN02str]|uniref:metallophosphoesterase family protein n=1 Tax=Leptolyngbya sp. AN02str TaxID=3423363 RepID=UPI003D31E576
MLRQVSRLRGRLLRGRLWLLAMVLAIAIGSCALGNRAVTEPSLLTDPFLQLPTASSVRVVWFTEFEGREHVLEYGEGFQSRAIATSIPLSHVREDQQSRVGRQTKDGQVYRQLTPRPIWRHEAEAVNLPPNQRIPYHVQSQDDQGREVTSRTFTLAPAPSPGTPLKILLTSDHQSKGMTAANLQKVAETVGQLDAVWMAGDLVNIPDRASEWFDDNRGNAFFPCLQGRAEFVLKASPDAATGTRYVGGEIIQHAPLFSALGNHEVMGRSGRLGSLNEEFEDAISREVALQLYGEENLKANSYNSDTYEEILTLPQSLDGGERYYAVTFGDVRLLSLYATNLWRRPSLDPSDKSRFREPEGEENNREAWGYGQLLFEAIAQGSPQYNWLKQELSSPEFRLARYKVVMLHHPMHSLGENVIPPYTSPVRVVERNGAGAIAAIRYDYPREDDYLLRDVMPLLEAANVQLVLYGHSHVWNRFRTLTGIDLLETSNVGNTYGAAWGSNARNLPDLPSEFYNLQNYTTIGDPGGLEPIVPTLAPLTDEAGQPLPYIASNDITVFSIFDTGTGIISSYRFDTRDPDSAVVKFDEFQLSFG